MVFMLLVIFISFMISVKPPSLSAESASIYGAKYSRMNQVKFVEDSFETFFKSCLPQILLGPFLKTLSRISQQNTYRLEDWILSFSSGYSVLATKRWKKNYGIFRKIYLYQLKWGYLVQIMLLEFFTGIFCLSNTLSNFNVFNSIWAGGPSRAAASNILI